MAPLPKTKAAYQRPKVYSTNAVVRDEDLAVFESRCAKAFKEMDMEPSKESISIFGNRPLDGGTDNNYLSKLRRFVIFLLDIKKYDESLLIFHPNCPKGTVACQAEAVSDFLYVAMAEVGKSACDMHKKPITDSAGVPLIKRKEHGEWNATENMQHFLGCLGHVHKCAHEMSANFVNRCDECLKVYKKKEHGGCIHHPIPRYTRTGNVATCTLVQNTLIHLKSVSTHTVKGSCHILPSDLRDIREYAKSSNDVLTMEIFTVLLMSVDLFLRKCEYSSLNEKNFNTKLFLLTDRFDPDALNISVKGKRTQTKERRDESETYACWRKLWIFGDDQTPDLDLKRHLLAFLYCIGWKGGFLFPTAAELDNPPADGVYKTCIDETTLVDSLKELFKTICKREDKLNSHCGRKTGYLFACLRGATMEQAMLAAAHKVVETAKKYMRDAEALATIMRRTEDSKQQLGEWQSPYCANGEETGMRATAPMAKYQCTLKELVVGFMEERIGIDPRDPRARFPNYVMEKLVEYQKVKSPSQEMKEHLRDVAEDKTNKVLACAHQMQGQAYKQAAAEHAKEVQKEAEELCNKRLVEFYGFLVDKEATSEDSTRMSSLFLEFLEAKRIQAPATTEDLLVVSPEDGRKRKASESVANVNKKERRGTKSVVGRDESSKLGAKEKIAFFDRIYDPNHGEYNNKDRQFLIRISGTVRCFRECCGKDVDVFLQKHGRGKKKAFTVASRCPSCETT